MKRSQSNREANVWIARGVPVFLLGIIGYASWVVTKALCVDYLLRSSPIAFRTSQIGPAVAILVIYYLLLCVMLVCYARLIYVVTRNPGLVPRGSQWYKNHQPNHQSSRSRSRRRHRNDIEKVKKLDTGSSLDGQTAEAVTKTLAVDADVQVEDFWERDLFVCNFDGRPAFCSTCCNWKPDRAHHCSELDRCILKMDHFCPWVGGVVGETSFKFFLQFTFWSALLCTHILVSLAYYFAIRKRIEHTINVHWAIMLGISGLFLLFSAGMCLSSLQFILINSTTIENLNRKVKVWYLAVYVSSQALQRLEQRGRSNLRLITYPRPPAEQVHLLAQNRATVPQDAPDNTAEQVEGSSRSAQPMRTFAILETAAGVNPFDLGFAGNFCDIMGYRLYEWLLPIHTSPCIRHTSAESFYKMGPIVSQLKLEARISEGVVAGQNMKKRRRKQHHERPKRRPSTQRNRGHSPPDSTGER